jgi:hypothetical protein
MWQVDHYSALEYSTKYATKSEKGSQAHGKMMMNALNKMSDRDADDSAQSVVASFLVQQTGGRDWSAQEVAHVNMGIRTVWASHEFDHTSLSHARRVKKSSESLQ